MREISVILPVYLDAKLTEQCINSAMPDIVRLKRAKLLIINDASPDPDMNSVIKKAESNWGERIQVVHNPQNQGFVKSVNTALYLSFQDDVVLLNSDVIVPARWLERLKNEAYSDPKIATTTPLSNNTTICTFPKFLQENKAFLNYKIDEIDVAFLTPCIPNIETPTGIGFCMFIKRDCLNEIGYLNKKEFPRGYGEENDLCQRSIERGWKNIITPNLYVYHEGRVSFRNEKEGLLKNARETLKTLHPNYASDVKYFIANDPLKKARIFRLLRLLSLSRVPKILHISHGLGGGTQTHIDEVCDYLNDSSDSFSIILIPNKRGRITIRLGAFNQADEIYLPKETSLNSLIFLIEAIGISLIHYHHVINLSDEILNLSRTLEIPHRLTIHNYYLICGNPKLTDKNGMYSDNKNE